MNIQGLTSKQKGFLAILLFCLVGGGVPTLTKIGLVTIPPLSFAFLRFTLASLAVIPIAAKKSRAIVRDFFTLTPLSLLATANIIFYILGQKQTTATMGQLIYTAVPLLTGLTVYFFEHEQFSLQKIAGIITGFMGILIIILLPILEKGQPFSGDFTGNLLIALGAIFFSMYLAFSQRLQKRYSPLELTSIFIFLTTIALFPVFLLDLYLHHGWWQHVSPESTLSLVYMGTLATLGTYLLNQYAVKHGGALFASMTYYLTPIVTYFTAFTLLGEGLTTGLIVGAAFALIGVILTTKT